ncbi:MAG TPA: penicillin-binding transpeptidase domain-containing protein [Anaeromyxobacteraceae bacterium]|nr:penicillin-binding transpeptidase domain-containing protein [Anaeromyxobacteraceae bacterium]
MSYSRLASWLLAPCLALFAVLSLPWRSASADLERPEEGSPAQREEPAQPTAGAPVAASPAPAQALLGSMRYDVEKDRYVASLGGRRAILSLEPRLQQRLEKLLNDFRVPVGAVVLLEPRTGRVLTLAEHAERGRSAHVALLPIAPAASIFKIVTSAALLDRGIAPDAEVCFHGGRHRIDKRLLDDNPRRDRRCLTLAMALGKSANVVFAKLAGRDLTAQLLRDEASRFLFDSEIPFDWKVEPSTALITDDPFDLATTAAGFGAVRLSPLHGALIAAIVADRGRYVPPRLVDEVDGAPAPARGEAEQVVREEVAAHLALMMETTVTEGTARKIFRRDHWARRSPLREVTVAGKTGSLADKDPYRDYSWFVGFAPVEDPQVAVAAVVVNDLRWRVKASFLAHEALTAYFGEEGRPPRTAAASP